MKFKNKKNGFTMTEIIVAVMMSAILVSLAIPKFTGALERTRAAEGVQILTAILRAQEAYKIETGNYYNGGFDLEGLDVEFSPPEYFEDLYLTFAPADPANPVALIQRNGGYMLLITGLGELWCFDIGSITCENAGFEDHL